MFTANERSALTSALETLEVMNRLYPAIPLSRMEVFACIATNPGVTMSELAKFTGMPQQTVSRNIPCLSAFHPHLPPIV